MGARKGEQKRAPLEYEMKQIKTVQTIQTKKGNYQQKFSSASTFWLTLLATAPIPP